MSLQKYVEIICDQCGNADFYSGSSKKYADKWWKDSGSLIRKNKHFCNADCWGIYLQTNQPGV